MVFWRKPKEQRVLEARSEIRDMMRVFDGRRFVHISLGQTVHVNASCLSVEDILNMIPSNYKLVKWGSSGYDHIGYCLEIFAERKDLQ